MFREEKVSKDTYYLKHDTNAAHDPKMEAMIQRFGMAGYGRFWRLAEVLREQADGKMRRDKWGMSTLSQLWRCSTSRATDFLNALIDDYELIATDKQYIWSERINRDMAILAKKREDGKKYAELRWQRDGNGLALASHR